MEERGAGPILFHLRALTQPEDFWPLIEQEIAARNFFLFCDSKAARSSPWVRRERETVKRIANSRAIRVGRVDLDAGDLDLDGLDRFLLNTRVFVVGDRSAYAAASKVLSAFGYNIFGAVSFSADGLKRLGDGSQMSDDMIDHLHHAAARGWLLVVLSQSVAESKDFWWVLPKPSPQDRVMFVRPSGVIAATIPTEIPEELMVVQHESLESALEEAARRMLSGGPDEDTV